MTRPAHHNKGFIYIAREINSGLFKIGLSGEVQQRLSKLAFSVELIHSIRADDTSYAEELLHKRYRHLFVGGEWFKLSGKELSELKAIKYIFKKREGGTPVSVTNVPPEIINKIDIQLASMGYRSRQVYLLDLLKLIANTPIEDMKAAIEAGTIRPRNRLDKPIW